MKKIFILLMAVVIGMASYTHTEASSEKKLTPVTVSEFRSIQWMSAYVADSLGYYEAEGLDVDFYQYKDGPVAFQGMHAGDSDFCLLSAEPVMRAYDAGMESYFILTNTKNRAYGFIIQSEYKTVQDLKGKTIFAGSPGSAPYSFVLSILKNAGMDENDVSFINMEYGASYSSFARKQLDAMYVAVYNLATLDKLTKEYTTVVDLTNPVTHKDLYGSEFCETTIVTCTKNFAKENPETVQAFVNANHKALVWMDQHSSAEIVDVVHSFFEGHDRDDLIAELESLKTSFSKTGEIHKEGYASVEELCFTQGLITKHIPFEDIVASDFIEKALQK